MYTVLKIWYNFDVQMGRLCPFDGNTELADGGRTLGSIPQLRQSNRRPIIKLAVYPRRLFCNMVCGLVLASALAGCASPGKPLNLDSLTSGPTGINQTPPTTGAAVPTAVAQSTVRPVGPTSVVPATVPVEVATSAPIPPTQAVATQVVVAPPSGEAAWNAQKMDLEVFPAPSTLVAPGNILLWWYDPASGQEVGLGWVQSPVRASGKFRLRWSNLTAVAVPYLINQEYGLSLEPSVVERIRRAGYTSDTIEVFVYLAPDMSLQ